MKNADKSGGVRVILEKKDRAELLDRASRVAPDGAFSIWRFIVNNHIARVQPSAYEAAVPFLKKMRQTWERLDRYAEWHSFVAELRRVHYKKRRLMGDLDALEGKKTGSR